jgi:hypothetical protein
VNGIRKQTGEDLGVCSSGTRTCASQIPEVTKPKSSGVDVDHNRWLVHEVVGGHGYERQEIGVGSSRMTGSAHVGVERAEVRWVGHNLIE